MKKANDFVTRKIFEKTLLVPLRPISDGGMYVYELNGTAGYLWENLEKFESSADMVKELIENFETTEEESSLDVEQFLSDMKEIRAIEC